MRAIVTEALLSHGILQKRSYWVGVNLVASTLLLPCYQSLITPVLAIKKHGR